MKLSRSLKGSPKAGGHTALLTCSTQKLGDHALHRFLQAKLAVSDPHDPLTSLARSSAACLPPSKMRGRRVAGTRATRRLSAAVHALAAHCRMKRDR